MTFTFVQKKKNCTLQMGGSDQWDITTGTELVQNHSGKAYALTCPLITKADGTKFGKSEGGNIWLMRLELHHIILPILAEYLRC
jgi:tyrosyl-tRNA synthetase